ALALSACGGEEAPRPDDGHAAQVGEEVLSETEVREALAVLPAGLDSTTARRQVIEQWVKSRLLAQEARRQGLLEEEDVRRQLEDNERAVLAAALIDRFFEANPVEPSDEEIAAYFEANRAQLALREPYLRLRLLSLDDQQRARAARASLVRANTSSFPDSLWALTVQEYTTDPAGTLAFASTYLPQSRLIGLDAAIAEQIRLLNPGEVGPVVESNGRFHVVQLMERVTAGTTPELTWVREELRQRLAIEQRNDMLIRQVEQLQNEAQAEGRLIVR
ncbi:MAG: peptidyl-prolyl cis-trans isomerase, partial [Rhodothermaceae bacterium]|nr:peptidyl-prolyl cis-trans isomerase [Rhodothermaceae bacterium]